MPASAEWYFDTLEWVCSERDSRGELHGSLRAYRHDGSPSLAFEYRHGLRHGPFRRFYASGKLREVGRYFDDLLDGLLSVFSDGADAYSIRECCIPEQARVMRQEHRRGRLLAEVFYDEAGVAIDVAGASAATGHWPMPLRERGDDPLLGAYGFWPLGEPIPGSARASSIAVEQPLPALRNAIRRSALRIITLRAALSARGVVRLPPDPSASLGCHPLAGREFVFRTPEGEPVHVTETLSVAELGARELLQRARIEWTGLCWLCWVCGENDVVLPARILPRAQILDALILASTRQAALSGHALEPDSAAHFHGLDETQLPASALEHLADHYREMRAVLLFATDPECQSPWQDDLGRRDP